MKLQLIDIFIICAYLVGTILIGLYFKKIAQKDKSSYLLGGNRLPWYMLGLSNASGMFDISGTMWLVTIGFVYGLKSIWIPWLWPVFNQIFLMVYLSAWLRRSNVTTGAEWIGTRFGKDKGSYMSHGIVVVFALISGLGFLAYGFIGLGKFMEIFIPWEFVNSFLNWDIAPEYVPHLYGVVFTLFAVFYSVLGGMVSIVWADLLQYFIMTVASVAIAIIAFNAIGTFGVEVPDGWYNPFFGKTLELDWSGYIADVTTKMRQDGYTLFSAFFMMTVFKGVLLSIAGPAPNYDMQKILATKSPAEASKMSGMVSAVLMPVRYLMIAGFVGLGIVFYDKLDLIVAGQIDFEQILPSAINQFVPVGLLGFLLAGLLAAFMSTFAGTLNAAQAYVTNDIYLKYINPGASNKTIKTTNYIVGVTVVVISILLGLQAKNVNQVLQILVSALWGGYTASNVLKWYWWRFNSHGYFWGMLAGILVSAIPMAFPSMLEGLFPNFAPDIRFLYYFPIILAFSLVGCIIATLATQPTDETTLMEFYKKVRPWGFWKPVHDKVVALDPTFEKNKNFWKDMANIVIGVVWQTCLVALPFFIIFKKPVHAIIAGTIILVSTVTLKFSWWDKLKEENN
jgi:solute:Na+ symporter, SSS family